MHHEESNIQISCVRWFRYQFPHLARLLFAVPNGGARNKVTASILKAEGVVAGVADLILLVPSKEFHGLCIEMKKPKGRQAETQKEWEKEVTSQGYKYIIARGFDDFREEVTKYLY